MATSLLCSQMLAAPSRPRLHRIASSRLAYARRGILAPTGEGTAGTGTGGSQRRLMSKANASPAAAPAPAAPEHPAWFETYLRASSTVTNLFPLWTVLSAALALARPEAFAIMSTDKFTAALAVLMFSMGITMTVDDFRRVLGQPRPVAINFLCCYAVMPALGLLLGKMAGLDAGLVAGLVLVGSINGGQASNLCTYIAKGDVAMSVVMTTSTTIGCVFMTPLIAKAVLGAIVAVDAVGIAKSTVEVVLLPIALGVMLNATVPKLCRAVEPICPVIGVLATVLLVGASVAQCAGPILDAGLSLQLPVAALHLLGGLLGDHLCKALKFDETIARTTAIETAMKSSAFGFLLASSHFSDYIVRVPSAVSVVWMAVMGSSMAVFWRMVGLPPKPDSKAAEKRSLAD